MLETKIEELTAAINKLIDVMQKAETSAPKAEEPIAEVAPEQVPAVTAESLQAICLRAVREDERNKKRIKDILTEHGASLIKDIPQEKYPEIAKALEALL